MTELTPLMIDRGAIRVRMWLHTNKTYRCDDCGKDHHNALHCAVAKRYKRGHYSERGSVWLCDDCRNARKPRDWKRTANAGDQISSEAR